MSKYLRLVGFLKYAKVSTLIKTLISLAMVAAGFAEVFFLSRGVSYVLSGKPLQVVFVQFIYCLLFLLLKVLLIRFQEGYNKVLSAKLKGGIRHEMLKKLMLLGPAYQSDKRSGNLQSLLTDGIESFEPYLTQYLPQIIVVMLTSTFSIYFMWSMDKDVGLLILIMTLISIVVPHLFMPAVSKVMIEYWQDYAKLNAQYVDDMRGMSTLKSLGVSKKEGKRLADMAWQFAAQSLRNLGISLSDSAIIIACTTIGTAASTAIAAYHMAQGLISYSTVLLILFFSRACMKPLYDLNIFWHGSYLGLSVAEELFGVLDEEIVITGGYQRLVKTDELFEIDMENLSFSYEKNGIYALTDVSIKFEKGKTTALVGKSGSGKSTIINLLLRFYDPDKGQIKIDGKDIKDISLEELRSNIAVVFQDTYLFYGNIIDNIRMARPDATDEEVIAAAKMASAHQFITNLPEGYYTIVGERGATLSGGERQRISIARAILKDAPILILDEATSSVDVKNEAYILKFMEDSIRKKTCIVIAHRLSTIEKADNIVVFEKGIIKGTGRHEELLKENEIYRHLARTQGYEC